ncbi:MAG: hypothetical protein KDC80_17280 [Saprospiraceae bacterium]|nr:hypothetical protein [Saprospiraceae bacterium]
MRRLFCFFLIGLSYPLNAQNPFNCHGRIFRVLEQQGGSMLQELVSNQMEEFLFEDLRFFPSRRINAIGFRESDGHIYGLLLGEQYTLCRIDAGFELQEIRTLGALPPNLLFVASDISPDNRYMVILGYSPEEPGNLLALIDLESSDFNLDLYSLGSDSDLSNVKCADIAFHPTTGQLYGYDHANYELVEIDINRKNLKRISTGSNESSIRGNVPSLFFDVDGNLYGIGSEREVLSNRSLILFSINSSSVKILKDLVFEGNQDACSCTASFQLFNSARNSSMINCTTNELKIEIRNFTGNTYSTTLTDTFPSGVRITDMQTRMNYSGVEGLGTNTLKINDLQISKTIDSIILQVFVEPDNPVLNYANKVYLQSDEVLPGINRKSIGSDDPATLAINDATWLEFRDLDFRFEKDTYFLCQDDSLFLSADIAADYFVWSTGSIEPAIWVTKPGTYQITEKTNLFFLLTASGMDLSKAERQCQGYTCTGYTWKGKID